LRSQALFSYPKDFQECGFTRNKTGPLRAAPHEEHLAKTADYGKNVHLSTSIGLWNFRYDASVCAELFAHALKEVDLRFLPSVDDARPSVEVAIPLANARKRPSVPISM
jgi:hypothetical protein